MKKTKLTLAIAITLACSMTFSSCIGSFALTNKVLSWNKQIGSKFVNELVFVAFWILPVYEISAIADVLVINTIEFWSGSNPVSANSTKVVDGKDARYLVQQDSKGYTIKNLNDNTEVRFAFDATDNSWSVEANGESHKFMTFVDDSHVKMITPTGDFQTYELSQAGVYAYQQVVSGSNFAYAK
ncbi:MAG: DUF3332 domain-containing protein [Bacteroidales bacterium]|nr:DUF3332 domain-containing protein [Bacteroidales bacterium]